MPAPAWTYSDWIIYASGDATRLSRLRLHIQEVSNAIKSGSYSVEGRSRDLAEIQAYLTALLAREKEEATASSASSATESRAFFTRGRAL